MALARKIQKKVQPVLLKNSFFTALGYILLLDQTVMLLALDYGANDLEMGLLYAALSVTSLAGVFVPYLFKGVEMTKIYGWAWLLRASTGFGYLLLLLFIPESSGIQVYLIIVLFYLTAASRSVGLVVHTPVIRALTPKEDLSAIVARIVEKAYLGLIFGRVLSALL